MSALLPILLELQAALLLLQATIAPPLPAHAQIITSGRDNVVQGVFERIPLLKPICSCESWGDPDKEPRQFKADGSILWGNDPKIKGATTTDVGMCQINSTVHAKEIKALGLDVVNSAEDNIEYAEILYNRSGWVPWKPSKGCWGKYLEK